MLFAPSVPSPPLFVMAVDVSSSTVSLTWSPPTEPNGILLFYRVVARQEGGNTEGILVDIPTNTTEDLPVTKVSVTSILSGLSPRTDYVITVKGNTSAGYCNQE